MIVKIIDSLIVKILESRMFNKIQEINEKRIDYDTAIKKLLREKEGSK